MNIKDAKTLIEAINEEQILVCALQQAWLDLRDNRSDIRRISITIKEYTGLPSFPPDFPTHYHDLKTKTRIVGTLLRHHRNQLKSLLQQAKDAGLELETETT